MTLDEAVKEFESRFEAIQDNDRSTNEHGEPFIIVCSGGIKEEGEPIPAMFSTQEGAIRDWLNRVIYYNNVKSGRYLYWRERPVLETVRVKTAYDDASLRLAFNRDWYKIYSRLVISEHPPSPR